MTSMRHFITSESGAAVAIIAAADVLADVAVHEHRYVAVQHDLQPGCADIPAHRPFGVGVEPAAGGEHVRLCNGGRAVELSGQLKTVAVSVMKIANDLRWMNSGPLAGLSEIALPDLQPGSSIMPGKVNPVIPEAVCMVCAQVMGHHAAVTVAGASGNFQLNVMLPLVAANLLDAATLLANAMRALADDCIAGLQVRRDTVAAALDRNPILVTALNPVIGYEQAAAIAKRAYAERRPVLEVAVEMTGLPEAELRRLLDPAALTRGGIQRRG